MNDKVARHFVLIKLFKSIGYYTIISPAFSNTLTQFQEMWTHKISGLQISSN